MNDSSEIKQPAHLSPRPILGDLAGALESAMTMVDSAKLEVVAIIVRHFAEVWHPSPRPGQQKTRNFCEASRWGGVVQIVSRRRWGGARRGGDVGLCKILPDMY